MARNDDLPGAGTEPLEELDEIMDGLEPEVRDGPFGIPFVAPKDAPSMPFEVDRGTDH